MQHLMETMQNLPEWNKYLYVFLLSMVPIIEQRGAIPLGFALGLHPIATLFISLAGSLVPSPFILWAFNAIYAWMHRFRIFAGFLKVVDGKIRKNTPKIEKYKELGLIVFVGIPLPTTGIWTGSAVAAFLGLNTWKSLLCALIGGTLSAIVITAMMWFLGGMAF